MSRPCGDALIDRWTGRHATALRESQDEFAARLGVAKRTTWKAALTPVQQRSPLAHRPYDLRHAAVSLWLNAGVPAPQVAEWAGHSVAVLLKVYAKCIDGQDQAAKRRIETAPAAATEDEDTSES